MKLTKFYIIELSNWGEIFLNPDLPNILAYSYQKSVALTASNGVNLPTVKPEVLEAVVNSYSSTS